MAEKGHIKKEYLESSYKDAKKLMASSVLKNMAFMQVLRRVFFSQYPEVVLVLLLVLLLDCYEPEASPLNDPDVLLHRV